MHKLRRLFLSRKTVLTLIFLILASIVTGYVFPQRFSSSPEMMEKWQYANPFWAHWVERFGLDHVYSTPWFSVLLFLFLISLTVSTYEQIKTSIRKTFGAGVSSGGKTIKVNASEEELAVSIKKKGYIQIFKNDEIRRFVKHPWGYWGNVLFHLGIVISIASSLLVVLTEKRGVLTLVEGEVHIPGYPWRLEENGIFAGRFALPEAVRIEKVNPEFWETDNIKQLTSEVSFISPAGKVKKYNISINEILNYKGLRIYQQNRFGNAFFVEFIDREGRKTGSILQIERPPRRDKASYENFNIEGTPYGIKAKYYADADKKSMISENPLLVLRLVDNKRLIGEVSLKKGESSTLGPYTVQLAGVSKWTGLIFLDITGMSGIFFGFFLIILGGCLNYITPPREFYCRKIDNKFILTWRAAKFEHLYLEEYKRAVEGLKRNNEI